MRMLLAAAASAAALAYAAGAQEVEAASDAPDVEAAADARAIEVPAGDYALDLTHARLLWRVMHMGFSNYTARMTRFDANLHFDPDDPGQIALNATIDPASVATDYLLVPEDRRRDADFDSELRGDNWLDVVAFPEITFVSTGVDVDEDYDGPGLARADVTGDLTIRGVTEPVTLDVTLNGAGPHPFSGAPHLGFSASTTLSRSAFGMTALEGVIGDEVEILLEAEFEQPSE